jgi:hypothetical protein
MFLDFLFKPLFKKEKVFILTEEHEITGWLYNPGIARRNRFLSDLLNRANKNFIAITDCKIVHKLLKGEVEELDFLQLNMRYIILIKPAKELEIKKEE